MILYCKINLGIITLLPLAMRALVLVTIALTWTCVNGADSEKDCKWWQSPIIVGGTEGSGTRGAINNVGELGAAILGVLPNCLSVNSALDTDCIKPKMSFGPNAWTPSTRAMIQLQDFHMHATPESLEELFMSTAEPKRTRRAMEGLVDEAKQPWRWAWKMPHTVCIALVPPLA